MARGKAPDLDRLTSEHLQYSHALLPVVLSKLFNLMMHNGYVPRKFGQSYTVPIPKSSPIMIGLLELIDNVTIRYRAYA